MIIQQLTGECPEPDSDLVQLIKEFDRGVNALFNPSTEGMLTTFPFLRHFPGYYCDACRDVTRSRDELLVTLFTQMKVGDFSSSSLSGAGREGSVCFSINVLL